MEDPTAFALHIVRPMLRLAPTKFLDETQRWLGDWGVKAAVAEHDTAKLFDWIAPLVAFQGIGDKAASVFAGRHASVTWSLIDEAMRARPSCPLLRSYWCYAGCGYRKGTASCSEPEHIAGCFVPRLPLRKGLLNQAAVSLFLFFRDVCGDDLVSWLDARLAAADPGRNVAGRTHAMRAAVLAPLCNVVGIGPKLWSMILSDLLLAGDPARERWVTAGASFVVVDSLVHAVLHRTGILRRFSAEHSYGVGCYAPGGCADVIEAIAAGFDASEFDPTFPSHFPRFVEAAIWHFGAEGGRDLCNGRHIDDRVGCRQVFCPAFGSCQRLPLGGEHG